MKRIIGLFGLLGLVGCFLPIIPGLSLFDMRHFDALQVYLMIGAFVVTVAVGFGTDRLSAGLTLLAMGCFAYILYKFGFEILDLLRFTSIGGIMMGVGAVGGFIACLASFTESRKA
jgi:hypothetical protein